MEVRDATALSKLSRRSLLLGASSASPEEALLSEYRRRVPFPLCRFRLPLPSISLVLFFFADTPFSDVDGRAKFEWSGFFLIFEGLLLESLETGDILGCLLLFLDVLKRGEEVLAFFDVVGPKFSALWNLSTRSLACFEVTGAK